MFTTEDIVELKEEDRPKSARDKEIHPPETALDGARAAVKSLMEEIGKELGNYDMVREAHQKDKSWATTIDPERHLIDTLRKMHIRNMNAYASDTLDFAVEHGFPANDIVLNTNPASEDFKENLTSLTTVKKAT